MGEKSPLAALESTGEYEELLTPEKLRSPTTPDFSEETLAEAEQISKASRDSFAGLEDMVRIALENGSVMASMAPINGSNPVNDEAIAFEEARRLSYEEEPQTQKSPTIPAGTPSKFTQK